MVCLVLHTNRCCTRPCYLESCRLWCPRLRIWYHFVLGMYIRGKSHSGETMLSAFVSSITGPPRLHWRPSPTERTRLFWVSYSCIPLPTRTVLFCFVRTSSRNGGTCCWIVLVQEVGTIQECRCGVSKTMWKSNVTREKNDRWIKFLEELFGNKFSLLLWAGAVLCFIGFGLQQASKTTTATTANTMVKLLWAISGVLGTVFVLYSLLWYYCDNSHDGVMRDCLCHLVSRIQHYDI